MFHENRKCNEIHIMNYCSKINVPKMFSSDHVIIYLLIISRRLICMIEFLENLMNNKTIYSTE